jgi:putative membrane protein
MRTILKHSLCAAAAVALLACGRPEPQRAQNPLAGRPKPQTPASRPSRQEARDPFGGQDSRHSAQRSTIPSHGPQASALDTPGRQRPVTDPSPQPSIWGPPESGENEPAAKERLNENEILAVAAAANDGEIQMGELARQKAQSNEVKQFAATLVSHHRQSMNKGKELLGKERTLEESRASRQVRDQASQELSTLRTESGKEFDRKFINAQVRTHENVLELIDERLMPHAEDPKVKSHLKDVRKNVATHLARAEKLQKKLDPALAEAREDRRGDTSKAKTKGEPKKSDPKE